MLLKKSRIYMRSYTLELVNDAKLRASMGERGRRRAIDEFDSEKCARALLEQYQRLVRERPRAGARSVTS